MVLYLVEQLPHCDLLRLIHQTERFVCRLASLSIKSVMDSFFFGHGYGLVGYLKLEHNLHLSNIWVARHMPNASIWVARHGKTWLIPFLQWQDIPYGSIWVARHDWYPFLRVMLLFLIVILQWVNVYGHITLKTPVLVWSLKLSNVEPRQYLDGWLPGNTRCCRQFIF